MGSSHAKSISKNVCIFLTKGEFYVWCVSQKDDQYVCYESNYSEFRLYKQEEIRLKYVISNGELLMSLGDDRKVDLPKFTSKEDDFHSAVTEIQKILKETSLSPDQRLSFVRDCLTKLVCTDIKGIISSYAFGDDVDYPADVIYFLIEVYHFLIRTSTIPTSFKPIYAKAVVSIKFYYIVFPFHDKIYWNTKGVDPYGIYQSTSIDCFYPIDLFEYKVVDKFYHKVEPKFALHHEFAHYKLTIECETQSKNKFNSYLMNIPEEYRKIIEVKYV